MLTLPKKRLMIGLGVAIVLLVLDQWTKAAILTLLAPAPHSLDITSFFKLFLTWNHGISFGLFPMHTPWAEWAFAGFVLSVVIYLLHWLCQQGSFIESYALGLVMGGALGNLIDRFHHGAVVDFLLFHYKDWSFAVFNIADAGITVGAGLILLDQLWLVSKRTKESKR